MCDYLGGALGSDDWLLCVTKVLDVLRCSEGRSVTEPGSSCWTLAKAGLSRVSPGDGGLGHKHTPPPSLLGAQRSTFTCPPHSFYQPAS